MATKCTNRNGNSHEIVRTKQFKSKNLRVDTANEVQDIRNDKKTK